MVTKDLLIPGDLASVTGTTKPFMTQESQAPGKGTLVTDRSNESYQTSTVALAGKRQDNYI